MLHRQFRSVPVSFQTRSDETGPVIAGYFAVFNNPTELWPGCIEQIAPGAFASSLNGDVRALIDHDTRLVIGRTVAGTLTLREAATGLYGEIKINEHDSDAMNLYARVQRGDVSQCSFGFDIVAEDYVVSPDGQTCTWTIREVKLYEVSVVTFPAYDATSVSARDADSATSLKSTRLERRKKELLERIKNHA
ncbi:MAG: HK97 family phage prohead protease [Oscillospiraceae bacterium]|nr:HK97 family phage prohead protease [Oscillospiraceae bacterium]